MSMLSLQRMQAQLKAQTHRMRTAAAHSSVAHSKNAETVAPVWQALSMPNMR